MTKQAERRSLTLAYFLGPVIRYEPCRSTQEMYYGMSLAECPEPSIVVDRGLALHKVLRLLVLGLGGPGDNMCKLGGGKQRTSYCVRMR